MKLTDFQGRNNLIIVLTWFAWTLFFFSMILISDPHRTVSYNYWLAAHHWIEAKPLYQMNGKGFIYLPQSAIFYIPLSQLSFAKSEWIWKAFSLFIFCWSLFRLAPIIAKITNLSTGLAFVLLIIPAIPLSIDSARNGQMNVMIISLMILTSIALSERRWVKLSLLLTVAFFLKPTAVVFLLLIAGLFLGELWSSLIIFGLLFLLLPFLTQSSAYVINQYHDVFQMLIQSANLGSHHPQDWSQLFNLFSQVGWDILPLNQNLIRILCAFGFLCWGYFIKKRYDLAETAVWLLTLGVVYLLLFNPRTENNDYIMLTPCLGFLMAKSIEQRNWILLTLLGFIIIGITTCFYLSLVFPGHRNWSAPLMGLLFLGCLLFSPSLQAPAKQSSSIIGELDC